MNRPTQSKSVFNNNDNNNADNNQHDKDLDVSDSMSQIGDKRTPKQAKFTFDGDELRKYHASNPQLAPRMS